MIGTSILDPHARIVYGPFPGHNMCFIPGKVVTALRIITQIRGALPLIHGPIGCSWQRKFLNIVPGPVVYYTPCTALTELDVVYGGEKKLLEAILLAYERYRPDMIVVLTTCASDMVGDDVESVVDEARKHIPVPIVYSTGSKAGRFRQVGAQDVLYSIVEQYVLPEVEERKLGIIEGSVNIQAMGVHGKAEITELVHVLSLSGISILKTYFDNTRVSDLLYMARACLNITPYRQLWADLVAERRNIKQYYISRYDEPDPEKAHPSGIEGFRKVLLEIGKELGKEGEIESTLRKLDAEHSAELEKLRKELRELSIAVDHYSTSIGIVLAREFNVKIRALVFYTGQLRNLGLSENAIKERIEYTVKVFEKYDSHPEVIVDEDPVKVCERLRRLSIDLAIFGRCLPFAGKGVRLLSSRLLSCRAKQHHLLGYVATIRMARTVLSASKRQIAFTSIVTYSKGRYMPFLPKQWDMLAELFGRNRT